MIAVTAVSMLPWPEIITTGTLGCCCLIDFEQLQPVEPRALQPDVEQDQLRAARFDRRDRLVGIARDARAVALVLQDAGDEFADVVFVVDDENVSGHQDDPILSFSRLRPVVLRDGASGSRHQDFGAAAAIGARQPVEQFDAAAMVLEDLDDDRQTEAGAFGARRHIGLNEAMPVFARKSFAVVADRDLDEVRPVCGQGGQDHASVLRSRQARRCLRRRSSAHW